MVWCIGHRSHYGKLEYADLCSLVGRKAGNTTKSREVLARFASITDVPQTRFYTAISQYDGSTSGEEAGGYVKAAAAKDINFMIIHKPAVIQFPKHIAPKIITPEVNQTGDGYKFGYRQVAIADAYENKVAGIYLHHKA